VPSWHVDASIVLVNSVPLPVARCCKGKLHKRSTTIELLGLTWGTFASKFMITQTLFFEVWSGCFSLDGVNKT